MTSLEIIFISKYLHFLLEKYKISLKTPQKAAIYVFFFLHPADTRRNFL